MSQPNGVDLTKFDRTERKFYELLCDGKPHSAEELAKRLWDDMGLNLRATVAQHIHYIRKKLPEGYHVTTVREVGVLHYLLVKQLHVA